MSRGTDWIDILLGPNNTAMAEIGAGVHSHTVGLTGQALDVCLPWWTSAFNALSFGEAPQASHATLTANSGVTYEMAGVQSCLTARRSPPGVKTLGPREWVGQATRKAAGI